jgi:hypothetical protein
MSGPTPQPVVFSGQFQLAADQSLPQSPIPFNFAGSYVALEAQVANPSGSGALDLPFGTIVSPGAVGLLIRYDEPNQAEAAPVYLSVNGEGALELTPGSFLAYFNALPVTGVTAAAITYTAACTLRIWVLG